MWDNTKPPPPWWADVGELCRLAQSVISINFLKYLSFHNFRCLRFVWTTTPLGSTQTLTLLPLPPMSARRHHEPGRHRHLVGRPPRHPRVPPLGMSLACCTAMAIACVSCSSCSPVIVASRRRYLISWPHAALVRRRPACQRREPASAVSHHSPPRAYLAREDDVRLAIQHSCF